MALTTTYDRTIVGPVFQTNTFTDNDQYLPDVLGLSNGGFVAAYNNDNPGGDDFFLLNFYAANASVIGSWQIPYSTGTIGILQPSLTQLANGNVLVVWDDGLANNAGLRGRLYSATGTAIGNSELTLSSFNDAGFNDPQVAALAGGGFVISFSYSDNNVWYGRYNDTGVQQGSFHKVNTVSTTGLHFDTAVAALADGGFVVTYYAETGGPSHDDVRAAIYNADDSVRTADFGIDIATSDQLQAEVAGLPNGNFAVVYRDESWPSESGSSGISLQIRSPTGDLVSAVIHVNTPTTTLSESDPDVTVRPNGFIVVTWTRPFSATDDDVYARVFDQGGTAIALNGSSSEFFISNDFTNENESAVSHLIGGRFITSWQDSHSDGSGGQISSTVSEITRTTTGDSADDTFVGDQLRDIVDGGSGNDVLSGAGGNDILIGGTGTDVLIGGAGDDTFYLDNAGDQVVENANEGTDTVFSTVDFALTVNFENLGLLGIAVQAYGNALANTIYGNPSDNLLNGGTGADAMLGREGSDSYFVDDIGDVVTENFNEGQDTVYTVVDFTLAIHVENLVMQGTAGLQGYGSVLANAIYGNSGNNTLDGKAGVDLMVGGAGNDSYFVDNAGDTIVENGNEGSDTVYSTAHLRLGANVENLVLQGAADLQGFGNAVANAIYGNSGSNILDGDVGADLMVGGRGNDNYYVDNAGDTITENANEGIDTVYSSAHLRLTANLENLLLQGSADLQGFGNSLSNAIYGNTGSNLLDGDVGADSMYGGAGADTYYVDNIADVVVENANEGNDTVYSNASLALAANVETLLLQGSADLQGYGNSLSNAIYGNSGNNLLDGGVGGDSMYGGAGNDVYYVDNIADVIVENVNEGADTVFSTANLVLAANVEQLVLQGAADLQGYGNGLVNALYGNSGNNILDGGGGTDNLTGNAGNDTFVFHAGQGSGDTVIDFAGNGAATGDSFLFVGYGTAGQGATFTQIGVTNTWQIHSGLDAHNETITLTNSTSVHATDVLFS